MPRKAKWRCNQSHRTAGDGAAHILVSLLLQKWLPRLRLRYDAKVTRGMPSTTASNTDALLFRRYYQNLLSSTLTTLHALCDTWQEHVAEASTVDSGAADEIRVAIGQTNLLMSKKMNKVG